MLALSWKPSTSDLTSLVPFTGTLTNSLEKQVFSLLLQIYIKILYILSEAQKVEEGHFLGVTGHSD